MDRSLDEIVAERQRSSHRGGRRGGSGPAPPRRGNYGYPRDGVRKPARPDNTANLDNDWVHDRYDDEETSRPGYSRPRGRRDDRDERYETERDRAPKEVSKIRVDNVHYDLTEDDIYELFSRLGPVSDVKMRYDRAGRSEGVVFVTYDNTADAKTAIREFDGANAKGQPIRLQLIPPPRRDNPFDRVENPRSLFDRIEAPSGRDRRRSESPRSDTEGDRGYRRGARRAPASGPRERGGQREDLRRSDVTKPAPENIDRYVPGQGIRQGEGRSSSLRGAGGRRPGERRERPRNEGNGQPMSGGRPKKTAEELDAEMEDYWGGNGAGNGTHTEAAPAAGDHAGGAEDDMEMIE